MGGRVGVHDRATDRVTRRENVTAAMGSSTRSLGCALLRRDALDTNERAGVGTRNEWAVKLLSRPMKLPWARGNGTFHRTSGVETSARVFHAGRYNASFKNTLPGWAWMSVAHQVSS